MARRLPIVLLLLGLLGPADAEAAFCSKPQEPWCVREGVFSDRDRRDWFDRCRPEIRRFVDEVESYQDCLAAAARQAAEEARSAIRRFNCQASGASFCP